MSSSNAAPEGAILAGSFALQLPDVRNKLRTAAPGTVVTFTVNHGGAAKDVKVTLRDLI